MIDCLIACMLSSSLLTDISSFVSELPSPHSGCYLVRSGALHLRTTAARLSCSVLCPASPMVHVPIDDDRWHSVLFGVPPLRGMSFGAQHFTTPARSHSGAPVNSGSRPLPPSIAPVFSCSGPRSLWSLIALVLSRSSPRPLRPLAAPVLDHPGLRSLWFSGTPVLGHSDI